MALTVVLGAFGAFWCLLLWRHLRQRKRYEWIPQPRSLPVIGHLPTIKPDVEGFVDQVMGLASLYPQEPRMVVVWFGPIPSVMVYSPEAAEAILTSPAHLNKGLLYDLLHPWLGQGLLTSRPEKWRPRRKLLTPTFHYDILKNFVHVFNYQSEILVQQLAKYLQSDAGVSAGGVVSDISAFVTLCALDIICETSMGQSVNAQLESDSEYVRAVHRINDIVQRRQKNPLVYSDLTFWLFGDGREHQWALNVLHSFTKKVIAERRASLLESGSPPDGRKAFLDLLLGMEQQGQLTVDDIRQEVDTFMFEGHDTTATGVTWVLHLLGCYPHVQERVHREIADVCGASTEVTMEQLGRLKYLECCIKEALRLHPSVPMFARTLGADERIGEHVIPDGTQMIINAYLIHRDPRHWPDPELFIPERFLTNNATGRHAYAFVPFSAGSRNCIGQRFAMMEEKTMLVWLLKALSRREHSSS
ncbi:CYP31B1 protein [Aphelenchoides avenae]|nr:CYP31B1 protein [Aphelenchus avenae]